MDEIWEKANQGELVAAWQAYGEQFSVFVPAQQPAPSTWKPDVPKLDQKGRVNPHYLKWKFFARSRDFLRQRYGTYHILEGPALLFDCLVPKFQPRIFKKSFQDEHGNPVFYEVKDSHE